MNYDCTNMIRIRKALRLTQDYMCELLGISRVSYTRREKGQTTFKVKENEDNCRGFQQTHG